MNRLLIAAVAGICAGVVTGVATAHVDPLPGQPAVVSTAARA